MQKISNCHSSPIKSIKYLNNLLFTGGYDQLFNILRMKEIQQSYIKIKNFNICLSEINSMDLLNIEENNYLIVFVGQGIEILKINI